MDFRSAWIIAWAFAATAILVAAGPRPSSAAELTLRSTLNTVTEPLTTERFWTADPGERNPEHKLWAVERRVGLPVTESRELKPGVYGVQADLLESVTWVHVRGAGPWFRPLEEFACEPAPVSGYATQEGSAHAAQLAASIWQELLKERKGRLALQLERVSGPRPELAKLNSGRVFSRWLEETEAEWKARVKSRVRAEEWRFYRSEASQAGLCQEKPKGRRKALPPLGVPLPSEKSGQVPELRQLLARAPARRWDGLFSVRVTLDYGGKKLVGQFLIDSGSAESIVSPDWLKRQGVNPSWVTLTDVPPQRISWSGGVGVAQRAALTGMKLGGAQLPMSEFLLMDTLLFDQPDHQAACCDGILGMDFLWHFAVEVQPGPPAELRLWPRENFRWKPGFFQVDVTITDRGELVSSCQAEIRGKASVPYVRWDTGSEIALDVHLPWLPVARKSPDHWDLVCQETVIARELKWTHPDRGEMEPGSPFHQKYPGMNVGIPILARGSFVFDLGHNRLWLEEASFSRAVPINRSGLQFEYFFDAEGDRKLRVTRVQPGSPAAALRSLGLKPGVILTRIGDKDALDLDHWDAERRISVLPGESVSLQWQISPKQVREGLLQIPALKAR